MFRKRSNNSKGQQPEANAKTDDPQPEAQTDSQQPKDLARQAPSAPRFPKPKLLVVDLKDDTAKVLKAGGYAVEVGTFGTPYKVQKHSGYVPVVTGFKLPNYAEQEIIIIDLSPNKVLDQPPGEKQTVEGEYGYWGKCSYGVIDPRPASMSIFRPDFNNILVHGGVFVIFADYCSSGEIIYARETSRGLDSLRDRDYDNWSFLSMLHSSRFETQYTHGSEITIPKQTHALSKLLARHVKGTHFTCTVAPKQNIREGDRIYLTNEDFESWVTLATNKYNTPVAGVFVPHGKLKGWVFIFPQLADKSGFIAEFLRDVLPELAPQLFPYAEGGKWVYRDEYQLPSVLEKRRRIEQIEVEARRKVEAIEEEIRTEQEGTAYLRDLLIETGDPLVKAVKKTLEMLGFRSVVDVDEEMKKAGDKSARREDLRILDEPTTLLVEVKGITGLPADADALQVQKYVVVRMREWRRTNVQGLEIINHQKGLPPLDREHRMPFREDILVNAEEQQFGLVTTWDLYRLTRNYLRHGWRPEQVKELFLRFGRIEPVPAHYELVGVVENFWERVSVVGVRVQAAPLSEGDRVAFEQPIEFEEQTAASLQVENQQVKIAEPTMLAGIKTALTKQKLRKGTRVFRIIGNLRP